MPSDVTVPRFLRRRVLWLLVLGAVLLWAVNAFLHIPVEVLPQFDYPQISVTAHLPGTTATELEHLAVYPLESQILTLTGLRSVRSVMGNGTVEIDVRFRQGTSAQIDLQAVNGAIDRARGQLPAQAHPVAQIMGNAINEVADYTVQIPSGVAPALVQRALQANIAPALRAIPGVQFVNVYGAGDETLWIQPDLDAMRRYGVGIEAIVQAVRSQTLLAPAGYLTLGHNDVLIEARSLPAHIDQLEALAVSTSKGPVPLRALARVVRSAVPTHNAVALDGRPSVALTVIKQPGASTVAVAQAVQATLDQTLSQLPSGVRWVQTYDQGHLVGIVGADLGRNLLIGALLAVLMLFWVLGAGRGIVMLALSIPLSLLLCIAALHTLGQDLNLMTFGALTVAVGLLADDAIIVLESIYHRWESGDAHWQGILAGLKSIVIPDVTGTLTNIAIYVPLLFVGGLVGLFFIPFSIAMILALLASLLVSLTLIPLGLGFINARPSSGTSSGQRLLHWLQHGNERLFQWVARAPRTSLAITFAVLLISLVGLVLVPINFLPLPNEGALLESFTLPPGASLLDTRAAVQHITAQLLRDPAVAHVYARIGSASSTTYTEPAYAGEIQVALKPGVSVNALDAIGQRIQRESQMPGVQLAVDTPTIERVGESLSGLPQPFVIHVFGASVPELRQIAQDVTARLRRIPALADVFNNDGYPVTQLQIEPRTQALAIHGLTPAALYAQLEPLIDGQIISRVPEGNVPLDLYVRLADAPQRSLADMGTLPIRSAGGWTPLGGLASLKLVETPNQIRHIAGARALDILATPTGPLGSTEAAARRALVGLRLPPGYRISFGGLAAELEQAAMGLLLATLAAFAIMIGILLLQFDGLLIPGILLLEIPLALTGGTVALVLSGVGLNATGMVGFLSLVGIGLRHSIVLLDRARSNENAGMPVEDAVREAIQVRFRPIVLTAVTAILGMLPTALGLGEGAAPEQGLAVVILGGLVWSALRSTNLIPALYLHWRRKQLARQAPAGESS
ncbi:MAG: efflux RND transporter permease subunit [Betaproteobacteria bacterium]|nr:efflux RND transporter permease subunit [Betaproteobacteria bacterium]